MNETCRDFVAHRRFCPGNLVSSSVVCISGNLLQISRVPRIACVLRLENSPCPVIVVHVEYVACRSFCPEAARDDESIYVLLLHVVLFAQRFNAGLHIICLA